MTSETARIDTILGGRLQLVQRPDGHRAGTDAVLLAAAAPANFSGFFADIGAGCGVVGAALALRCPDARGILVEIDPAMAECARQTVALNVFEDRLQVIETDIGAPRPARELAGLMDNSFDLIVTNPPFRASVSSRDGSDARRSLAHAMPSGGLDRWIAACAGLLRAGGQFTMIHRADALAAILAAMAGRLGAISLTPIHPSATTPATRLIVSATKGSRKPLTLRSPMVLHIKDGRFTDEAAAIHAGIALLT